MSSIFDFKKRFGQEINVDELKKDFVNKINYALIEPLDQSVGFYYGLSSDSLFNFVAIEFNFNPSEIINTYNRNSYASTYSRPPLTYFSSKKFEGTMLLVEILYEYYSKSNNIYGAEDWIEKINKVVKYGLNQPESLGVSWKDGKFYPEGVEEFDEKLISDVLKWLDGKPKIKALYENALDHYSQSITNTIKRKDVISNAFQAVEKLTKEFLETQKDSFDNNFNALVDKLDLDKQWNKIFNSYKELSKEFGRHAGSNHNFIPKQEDTEAFLYLSGLIMRLILQKSDTTQISPNK